MPRMKKTRRLFVIRRTAAGSAPARAWPDGPLCRGGQAARCVCKRDNALPLCLRQYPQLFQRLARKARQQRSQKSVARARSVHRVHFAGRQQPAARRSTVVRAPRPQRHQNQRRAPGRQRVRSRRQLHFARQQFHFFLRYFHDIRQRQRGQQRFSRPLRAIPQKRTVVWIVTDHRPRCFCLPRRLQRSRAARLVRQRNRTKMKDAAVPQQRPVHFGRREHHVRTRLAVKREASVALRRQLHKGQRRGIFPRHTQTAHVHTSILHRLFQKRAESVVPHLADKCGFAAQLCGHCQHIGRRAARVARKQRHPLAVFPAGCKVDQALAQRHDIKHTFLLKVFG